LTKQYKKYHQWIDNTQYALTVTCDSYQSVDTINNNLKEKFPKEDLKLALAHLCYSLYCHVNMEPVSGVKQEVYQTTFQGLLFLEEGGFNIQIYRSIQSGRWITAKTISAAVSTLAIVIIGIFQFKAMDESNTDRQKVKILPRENDSLKRVIKTIDMLHKPNK
jgi:hypothetical protein